MAEYKEKIISLNRNKKLISMVKKEGIEVFNPKGKWNGYGYEKLPMSAKIKNRSEMIKFNKIKKEVEQEREAKLTEEEKVDKWAKRLSKLAEISLENAKDLAQVKKEYHAEQIAELQEKQYENYSVKRDKLIRKLERESPLRYIKDEEHAFAIIYANNRHLNSNYEELLDEGKRLRKYEEVEDVREYARQNFRYKERKNK